MITSTTRADHRDVDLVNGGILPWVPEQGSVGASGDLAPLAHIAQVLMGEGEVMVDGAAFPAGPVLASAGVTLLSPLVDQVVNYTADLGLLVRDGIVQVVETPRAARAEAALRALGAAGGKLLKT